MLANGGIHSSSHQHRGSRLSITGSSDRPQLRGILLPTNGSSSHHPRLRGSLLDTRASISHQLKASRLSITGSSVQT